MARHRRSDRGARDGPRARRPQGLVFEPEDDEVPPAQRLRQPEPHFRDELAALGLQVAQGIDRGASEGLARLLGNRSAPLERRNPSAPPWAGVPDAPGCEPRACGRRCGSALPSLRTPRPRAFRVVTSRSTKPTRPLGRRRFTGVRSGASSHCLLGTSRCRERSAVEGSRAVPLSSGASAPPSVVRRRSLVVLGESLAGARLAPAPRARQARGLSRWPRQLVQQ